jgi:hypothetical protein
MKRNTLFVLSLKSFSAKRLPATRLDISETVG